jgi:hypothetical protein
MDGRRRWLLGIVLALIAAFLVAWFSWLRGSAPDVVIETRGATQKTVAATVTEPARVEAAPIASPAPTPTVKVNGDHDRWSGLETDNMESRTAFDSSSEMTGAVDGLLAGSIDPGPIVKYIAEVVSRAELIEESPNFRDTKGPGARRWIVYRSGNGEDCRAVVERYVNGAGEREVLSFSGPFQPAKLVNTPNELKDSFVSFSLDRAVDLAGYARAHLDIRLRPDARDSNNYIKKQNALMVYQGTGVIGRRLDLFGDERGWKSLSTTYPTLNAEGSFQSEDIDWDRGRQVQVEFGPSAAKAGNAIRDVLKKKSS